MGLHGMSGLGVLFRRGERERERKEGKEQMGRERKGMEEEGSMKAMGELSESPFFSLTPWPLAAAVPRPVPLNRLLCIPQLSLPT